MNKKIKFLIFTFSIIGGTCFSNKTNCAEARVFWNDDLHPYDPSQPVTPSKPKDIFDSIKNNSGVILYGDVYEFDMQNSSGISSFNSLWNEYFSFKYPKTKSVAMYETGVQNLGNYLYTSKRYTCNSKTILSKSLGYKVTYDPEIANTTTIINDAIAKGTSTTFGFGPYVEGSFYVDGSFKLNFNFTDSTSDKYFIDEIIDFTAQGKTKGNYELFVNYCRCDKFFFKYNSSGTLIKSACYRNVPAPDLEYTFKKTDSLTFF